MAEKSLRLNQRVEVTGKDVRGVVAYVGSTMFASGKWIGVILDEPRGKNNGTVQGKSYFQCKENHGMFVRQSQLTLLDDSGIPISDATSPSPGASTATTPDDGGKSRSRLSSIRRKAEPTTVRRKSSPAHGPRTKQEKMRTIPGRKTSSRLSLVSSRSQGDFPGKDDSGFGKDLSNLQQTSEPTSKRASFIEKFSTSSKQSTQLSKQVHVALKHASKRLRMLAEASIGEEQENEIENLKCEVRDLQEKIETLKVKRMQDKGKLKDYDKIRLQLEQLLEFKSRIMESQTSLQREVQRAKQEAREAIEARDTHAEEMADLAETVEMATLDKEMAEEKAETLQLELEATRERIEELTLDLEIIKAEISERAGGGIGESRVSTYEIKQLEQQNIRLRDTLVRMRDLSAHEKHEFQKLQKDLDQRKSEIAELARTKEKLSSRVEEMEHQIADLQEQVDAALGAEEMVQQLADSKLTLEERVKDLEEAVADLEALQDMNEQLQEGSRELEVELREEVDLANFATREAQREKEAALETLADREITIAKFRELVQQMQEQSQELQQRLERESTKPVSALPEILDFKKMFTESKAHTKAIDLELRRLDVQQSNQHVQYLAAYMPETFMSRGGDHDAILVLLLISRLLWKAEILLSQVRDKFLPVENIDRIAVVRGHAVEQFTFKSRLCHYVYSLQATLHQFLYGLNSCSPDTLLKVGAAYPEMAVQEKAVDMFVELLRKDQLDENVTTEALERCVAYFNTVYPVLIGTETKMNQTYLLGDSGRALSSACDSICTDAAVIKTLIQAGQESEDIGSLSQYLVTAVDVIQQQLKQIRLRIPQEGSVTQLGFSDDVTAVLQQCCHHAAKVMKTLQDIVKASLQQIALGGDLDVGLPHDKVKEFAHVSSDRIFEHEDCGPVESLKTSIDFIQTGVAKIAQAMQDGEYDINTNSSTEEKPVPPIVLRAHVVKKELEETKNLKQKLEAKEADIKELRISLKLKQEEMSEITIRKELAEKKLGNVNKDYELTIEKLQRKLDDAQQLLKRKEKEFEETMDHLQADIDSLETERGELKEKLKNYSKKALIEGISKTAVSSPSPVQYPSTPSLPAMVRDSPLLMQQIKDLRIALRNVQNEKLQLQTKLAKNQLDSLQPLKIPKKKIVCRELEVPKEQDDKENQEESNLGNLVKKASALHKEILHVMVNPKVIDISSRVPGTPAWLDRLAPANYLIQEVTKLQDLQKRVEGLQMEVVREVARRKAGGRVKADFALFPSTEMTKALHESKPEVIGHLTIPVTDNQSASASNVPLILNAETLMMLQRKLLL
ncbi:LOW QUALITY PROTEIN: dynactin subunit 1-like [Zootermopsis nevadensis]|uniref:LOW QUALITY PROTEIN: dynactin subunit 1-like n=1 Tax=Zootermopsis nevadensis TaxID=136037 RepID=UPI000B8E66CE|nr:LOW QUALITY PROTEIN: dynactin subunit 1-like [Zootermopsis nevadensis]